MIKISGIYKSFGNTPVLKNISAEFQPGKTNLIIGKSGAGKTVLLKLLVGLIAPNEGQIFYNKVDFLQLKKKDLRTLRMKVGMLFQGSALFDSLTVEENIRFPLDMFTDFTKKEKSDRVNTCLNRVSLDGINAKFPSELSGGMQKRVGIARAIVLNPSYLFCDEPNSGLDPLTAVKIDLLIQEITVEYGITTIVISHDMNSVMRMGQYIMFLKDGKKMWEGNSTNMMSNTVPELQEFLSTKLI